MKRAPLLLTLAALAACEPPGTPLRYDLALGTVRYRETLEEVVRARDGSLLQLTQIEANVRVQMTVAGEVATIAVHHEAARGRRLEASTGALATYDVQFPDRPGGDPVARATLAEILDDRFDEPETWTLGPRGPTAAEAWPWHLPLPETLRPGATWRGTLPTPGDAATPLSARFAATGDLEGVPCSELVADVAALPPPAGPGPAEVRVCVSPSGALVWQSLHRLVEVEGRMTETTVRRVALAGREVPSFTLPLDLPEPPGPTAPPGRDRLGDALPAGALARLGTTRGLAPSAVIAVVPAPAGAQVALLHADGLTVMDARTGVTSWHRPAPALRAVTWSPDGGRLLTAGGVQAGQITWWRAADGATLRTTTLPAEPRAVALAASGEALVAGADDRLWRVAEAPQALPAGVGALAALALRRDQLAVAGAEGVAVLDLGTGALRRLSEAPTLAVAWLPEGLLALGRSGLTWWDPATGGVDGALPLKAGNIKGSAVLTTSTAGDFAVWAEDVGGFAGGLTDGQLAAAPQPGRHLCVAADGSLRVATGDDDRVVSAWRPGDVPRPAGLWRATALGPDALASLDARGEVRTWALGGGAQPTRWLLPAADARALAWPAGGGLLAASATARWALGPDASVTATPGPGATRLATAGAALLAISPDGARLDEGAEPRWHLTQGDPCAAALSADGQRAAVALRTGDAVQVRATASGEVPLRATTRDCRVALSADGRRLAVLGPAPNRARVLAVPDGDEVATVVLTVPGGVVGGLALDATGARLAVGGDDQVALYDLARVPEPPLPEGPNPPTLLFRGLDGGAYVDLHFVGDRLVARPAPGTSALVLDAAAAGRPAAP